jgi:uncharacterized protein (TIGR00290 family)
MLALRALRQEGVEPAALLTTFTEPYDRVSMHGVRRELLERQARALDIPLAPVWIPAGCSNELYDERMARAVLSLATKGVDTVAFGDIFLEDVRAYREQRLACTGMRARFPLWGTNTATLAQTFVTARFEALLVCLDPRKLDRGFAGRPYDEDFLAELPAAVDPCGENGEFHTFVVDGPTFARRVRCDAGQPVERDGFVFCDLVSTCP